MSFIIMHQCYRLNVCSTGHHQRGAGLGFAYVVGKCAPGIRMMLSTCGMNEPLKDPSDEIVPFSYGFNGL